MSGPTSQILSNYSLPMLHRPTKPLSGVCLVVSGGVWSVSGGVNVNRLISPELMHVSEAADALVLLMQRALLLLKMN